MTITASIFKAATIKGSSILWENRKGIKTWAKSKSYYRNKKIRFSLSYIYRIKIPEMNRYLLVRNRKFSEQLQPVGGVYKRYGDDHLFESWEVEWDSHGHGMDIDNVSHDDLRFCVKGKYVPAVLKWFDEKRERETDPRREFDEELLDTGILCSKTFDKFRYKQLKRFSKNFNWSSYHNCHEILIYDVIEFLPSEEQKSALTALHHSYSGPNTQYAIVSPEEIISHRVMDQGRQLAKIGEHTNLIINKSF